MFLHLSHDEKFIDSARAAFERAAPGQHQFMVVDAPRSLRYIRTFEPLRVTIPIIMGRRFLESLCDYEAVVLHSLNKPNRLVVDQAPAPTNFVWLGWGYDYYHLICRPTDLIMPETRAMVGQGKTTGSFNIASIAKSRDALRTYANPRESHQRLLAYWRSRYINAGASGEMAMLRKIAFFAPVLEVEDTRIRHRHPNFGPMFVSWNYGVHHILDNLRTIGTVAKLKRIVVGNNATPECNHLEALDWIARSNIPGEIICPLSYGDPHYRDFIVAEGHRRFGSRFRPLTDYIEPSAYTNLVASASHLVMNHLRQQGLTNILIALHAGTRVLLNTANPLYDFLTSLGLRVDRLDCSAPVDPIAEPDVIQQREIVSTYYGADNHHRRTEAFLSSITNPEPARSPCTQ